MLENPNQKPEDLLDSVQDMREYDVPYHVRVCIDNDIRISRWYSVKFQNNYIHEISLLSDKTLKPELRILGIMILLAFIYHCVSLRY